MELLGGDADLGAQTELAAVGEARARIGIDRGSVDLGKEALACFPVLGNDGLR